MMKIVDTSDCEPDPRAKIRVVESDGTVSDIRFKALSIARLAARLLSNERNVRCAFVVR